MAGWSKIVGGSGLGATQHFHKTEPYSEGSVGFNKTKNRSSTHKPLKCIFNEIIVVFLKDVFGTSCFRPLPRLIGDGHEVDLFRLYLVVRDSGGYENVAKKGLWNIVAKQCGFDSGVSSALKLIYIKYLDLLEEWLRKLVEHYEEVNTGVEKSGSVYRLPMDLVQEVNKLLSVLPEKEKKSAEFDNVESKVGELGAVDGINMPSNGQGFVELTGVQDDNREIRSDVVDEDNRKRKRKPECCLGMWNWVLKVAMDPGDPEIGSLPEWNKWEYYSNKCLWKKFLIVRKAFNVDSSTQQSVFQKKQKMHPRMYDDQSGPERLRCSKRLQLAKGSTKKPEAQAGSESSSGKLSDEDHTEDSDGPWSLSRPRQQITIGPNNQADLPEWAGKTCDSDPKWLGTPIWPLPAGELRRNLIERDRIGKGRQDSCGCQFPISPECVRFHVAEKRMRVKQELGSAFYNCNMDNMGEQVALSWTKEEEYKFQNIVKAKPSTMERSFWDELFKNFPNKSREVLVSYYFNVYLLRRRADQNRTIPCDINSDDDGAVYRPRANRFGNRAEKSPGSMSCSRKKPNLSTK